MPVSHLAVKYQFENFGPQRWHSRNGTKITTIVIHHAATTNFDLMPELWRQRPASAHYGIGQKGVIRAYVDEEKAAWHCGSGNNYSIGIECTNSSLAPNWQVAESTIDALVSLCQEIKSRRGSLQIVAHRDIPGNATECPGPFLYSRMSEIRKRINNTNLQNQAKGVTTMQCIYWKPSPNNKKQNDAYYFNGVNCRYLSHPDQIVILKQVYKANNGKDLPEFWWTDPKGPWYARLEQAAPVVK